MSLFDTETSMADDSTTYYSLRRSLQQRGNTSRDGAITIIYLVVLAACILLPFCYYLRLRRAEAIERRQEDAHREAIANSVRDTSRGETRATRKKMREEKRARIKQLFLPVREKMTADHFYATDEVHIEPGSVYSSTYEQKMNEVDEERGGETLNDPVSLGATTPPKQIDDAGDKGLSDDGDTVPDDSSHEVGFYLNDSSLSMPFVRIPVAGISRHFLHDLENTKREKRFVANDCAICLANYEVGETVVWSSNPKCEHAFHEQCIEKWLMKLRGDPLCPCCRREFIIDPFDLEDGMDVDLGSPGVIEFEEEDDDVDQDEIAS